MNTQKNTSERIAVIGLGYVGLPVAVSLARIFESVIGFDKSSQRIAELSKYIDGTREVSAKDLEATTAQFTDKSGDMREANFYIVTVPTPIDEDHKPDLEPLISASRTVGTLLAAGDVVVYESTVYPSVTEEICGAVLEEYSGLKAGIDFNLAYSPERVNPGDPEHTFEKIVKVVSGDNEETLERVAAVYSTVVTAGIHKAPSIKVAEAAKVIENIQRDLNIALMNELSLIFDRLELPTKDVIDAASTKWNFLPFRPGLVGGHCIGVDPYYLTTRAEQVGYHPQVILAGRRVNERMGNFVAQKCIKLMVQGGRNPRDARVGVLGVTFKENIPDTRNTRVTSLVRELEDFGIKPLVHDPLAHADEVEREYGIRLASLDDMQELDSIILAVPHAEYLEDIKGQLFPRLKTPGVFIDVKAAIARDNVPTGVTYWSL